MARSTHARIASNIVQGIGVLGAGVIMREAADVVGIDHARRFFAKLYRHGARAAECIASPASLLLPSCSVR